MEGAKWMDIRSDRQKGLRHTAIGRKHNIDPRTAKRYEECDSRPGYSFSEAAPSKLKTHKQQITLWLEEAPYAAQRILEKMRYIAFVTDMSTNTPIRCHANAFRYFGAYPAKILYDNMKQVVIKRLLKQRD